MLYKPTALSTQRKVNQKPGTLSCSYNRLCKAQKDFTLMSSALLSEDSLQTKGHLKSSLAHGVTLCYSHPIFTLALLTLQPHGLATTQEPVNGLWPQSKTFTNSFLICVLVKTLLSQRTLWTFNWLKNRHSESLLNTLLYVLKKIFFLFYFCF